jgi:O-antigen ligase
LKQTSGVRTVSLNRPIVLIALVSGIVSTSFIDPINWPKQIALCTVTPWLLWLALKQDLNFTKKKETFYFLTSLTLALTAHSLSPVELDRKLWGYWSRSNGLLTTMCFILISFAFFNLAKTKNFTISMLITIELFGFVTAVYGLFQKFGLDPFAWSVSNQVFGTFGNTNFASAIWSLCAMSSISLLVIFRKDSKHRFVHGAITSLLLMVIFWTRSIQGLMAFGIFLIVLLFLFAKRRGLKFVLPLSFFITISAIVVIPSMFGVGLLGNTLEQYTLKLRSLYWIAGLKMGNSSPFIGVGVDSYGDYFRNYRSLDTAKLTSIDLVTNNAHNTFIQSYATLGILGLCSVLLIFLVGLLHASKNLLNKNSTFEQEVISAIFVAIWLIAFISIDNIAIAVWNWTFLGLVIGNKVTEAKLEAKLEAKDIYNKRKNNQQRVVEDFNPLKFVALAICAISFTLSWSSSQSDRGLIKTFNTPTFADNQESIDKRANDLLRILRNPIVQEGHYLYVAKGLIAVNKHAEAIATLESGLKRYPRDFTLLSLMAQEQIDFGAPSDGIKYLKQMTKLDPRRAATWFNLSILYANSNNIIESKKAAEKAFQYREFLDQKSTSALESLTAAIRIESKN